MHPRLPQEAKDRIPDWRLEHGKLYCAEIGSEVYVFRALTFKEFKQYEELANVVGKGEGSDLPPFLVRAQDFMFVKAVLWPQVPFSDQASVQDAERLVSAIRTAAGFGPTTFRIRYDKAKQTLQESDDEAVVAIICKAFNAVHPDMIAGWPLDKILRYLVLAEEILQYDLYTGAREQEQAPQAPGAPQGRSVASQRYERTSSPEMTMMQDHPPVPMGDPMKGATIDIAAENKSMAKFLRK